MRPTSRHRELARIAVEALSARLVTGGFADSHIDVVAEAFARELGPIRRFDSLDAKYGSNKSDWVMRAPKRRGK